MEFSSIVKIIMLVASPILGMVAYKINDWYKNFLQQKFKLKDHPIISNLLLSKSEVHSWNVPKYRQFYKKMVLIKFRIWREQLLILSEQLEKLKLDNGSLQSHITLWAVDTIKLYDNNWKNEHIPIEAIEIFDEFHQPKVTEYLNGVAMICNRKGMYVGWKARTIAIFDLLNVLLSDTKNDVTQLIYTDKFDNRLKGVNFKGIPCIKPEFEKSKVNE